MLSVVQDLPRKEEIVTHQGERLLIARKKRAKFFGQEELVENPAKVFKRGAFGFVRHQDKVVDVRQEGLKFTFPLFTQIFAKLHRLLCRLCDPAKREKGTFASQMKPWCLHSSYQALRRRSSQKRVIRPEPSRLTRGRSF